MSTDLSLSDPTRRGLTYPVRIVTAAALFDGHDASINVMRRIMQASGAEVIHLGHNRSVEEIVQAVLQEDANGVAVTSYQGGHMEFFTYMRDMLDDRGAKHVRIYGGGGGVIVPEEIAELHKRGIDKIFSPDDGRRLGLQGMIDEVIVGCHYDVKAHPLGEADRHLVIGRLLTEIESECTDGSEDRKREWKAPGKGGLAPVVGLTGTGGAGKSSLTDELVRRFVTDFPSKTVGIICVDPTKRRSGGSLLGDRIRFNSLKNPRVFMRSVATRSVRGEVSAALGPMLEIMRERFDLVFVETAGIGQGDSAITEYCDLSVYVMTSEYGAPSQLEKIEMLDFADVVVVNKFTRRGSEDALRDVRKQFMRNREHFDEDPSLLPVFGTSAAHFNDSGVNALHRYLLYQLDSRFEMGWDVPAADSARVTDVSQHIIPPGRERYLSEIASACRQYRTWAAEQADRASELHALQRTVVALGGPQNDDWEEYELSAEEDAQQQWIAPAAAFNRRLPHLDRRCHAAVSQWKQWASRYEQDLFHYEVRGRRIDVVNYVETLSGTALRKVALPRFRDAGDRLFWRLKENVPGEFPFTAGVFPFKRQAEDPTRMFAGEGPAERTNRRFHLLADGQPAKRLSTAFDSITLYGNDPASRPDIYGKIGESGVSVFTVEEAERLYAGFDLCDRATSVSMTINGPAPTMLAFFLNTAIRQQCRRWLRESGRLDITAEQELQPDCLRGATWESVRGLLSEDEYRDIARKTLQRVRGTVQADILKEDQGQNTCIFSTEFSLRCMGDVQEYFIANDVKNFYSVSISGYHIAEAGANPIHQLAFTLANGFTYVEYYLARGMKIDDFAPSLSFFFSNGMDAEYTVIGRVARRIWAVALDRLYGGDRRSQMLKYHIQTSGRSLHAQEIEFNDIRTTLQALLATFDNAQSLHTNAYDEAITTPTDESVRRAMAIQVIINREFGLADCENATAGSFIVEELTDLVEEAVLQEFDRMTERGGVLGAMERQYQRGTIQDDSLKYERMKHSGELPIVGVNTFLPKDPVEALGGGDVALTRASAEEKAECLARLERFQQSHGERAERALAALRNAALSGGNLFAALIDAATCCSLGQITRALHEVGGEYRRNL